jgi:hypothetical protein
LCRYRWFGLRQETATHAPMMAMTPAKPDDLPEVIEYLGLFRF